MKMPTKNFRIDVGKKLNLVRKQEYLTRSEMAARLELNKTNYYKNEIGYSLPGINTMFRLHTDFDISIDWLLFDSQPMHNKDKFPPAVSGEKKRGLQEQQPAITELLDAMEKDPMFLHEIILYYFKYKKASHEVSVIKKADAECAIPGI